VVSDSETTLSDFYTGDYVGDMHCFGIVVKANGKGQISTLRDSKTSKRNLMKPTMYNYVVGMATHANP